MTRYEFLKSMGFKGGALMAVLASCVKEEDTFVSALTVSANAANVTPPANTLPVNGKDPSAVKNPLLKIDLTSSAAANLKNVSGYIAQSGIVVAQVAVGVYAAVTQTCSHEPKKQVIYNAGEFYCTAHGARFDLKGVGKNSVASRGIAVYQIATDGKTLVVY
jgi:Rieske Fe-S protein